MKKNRLLRILIGLSVLSLSLAACNFNGSGKQDYSNDQRYDIYQMAVASGYNGTYEEWLQSIKGKDGQDGHSPVITIGDNGHWYIDGVDTVVNARGDSSKEEDVYHTVTFDSDEGTPVAPVKVKHRERIPKPEDPTKYRCRFGSWEVVSGTVGVDMTRVYENGEVINNDWCVGEDNGAYLALSDLTLKAYWYKINYNINIWYTIGSGILDGVDLINKINAAATSIGERAVPEYRGYSGDLIDSIGNAALSGQGPELFILQAASFDDLNDADNCAYSINPDELKGYTQLYSPLPQEHQTWILNNFDSSTYSYVYDNNKVLGYPLFTYNTTFKNKNTNEYDIPGKLHAFLFINGILTNGNGYDVPEDMYDIVCNFAKVLSESYLPV